METATVNDVSRWRIRQIVRAAAAAGFGASIAICFAPATGGAAALMPPPAELCGPLALAAGSGLLPVPCSPLVATDGPAPADACTAIVEAEAQAQALLT